MRLRLFRQFIVRRMAHERGRTLTTVAGIALGIGVVIAIQLTNASSVRGFETALDTVSGRASIEILGTGGIDETLLPSLGWLRQFGSVSPVIEGDMAIVTDETPTMYRPRRSEAVKVLGVDILRDRTLRDYAVGAYAPAASAGSESASGDAAPASGARGTELTSQAFLELLTSPHSVVITEKLARRRGYQLGDEIPADGRRPRQHLRRAGAARRQGPARVMDGSFVLMDIAAAQLAFARLGRIDRLDVQIERAPTALDASRAPSSADLDAAAEAIGQRLPAGLTAARPSRRGAAGGAHARRFPPEPDGAVVGGPGRGAVPGLQHGHRVGAGPARRNGHAARARRHPPPGARPVPGRGRADGAGRGRPGPGIGAAAGRCGRGRDRRHGEHALHRHGGRAARPGLGPRWCWRCSSACRCRCWPPRCRRSRPAACRPRQRCAAPTVSTRACACGRARSWCRCWCWPPRSAWRSSGRSTACRSSGISRPSSPSSAPPCSCRRWSTAWPGWRARRCGGCSASKACWPTRTWRRPSPGCRSRLRRCRSAWP